MPVKIKAKTTAPAKPVDNQDMAPQAMIVDFGSNYLTYHLHDHNNKPTKPRDHNVVHASDLDPSRRWCPREPALLTKHNLKRPAGHATLAQRMTWKLGYAGSDAIQALLPQSRVWGDWQCLSCKKVRKHVFRPTACHDCGCKAMRYKEVFMRDPESTVVGSCDLWFDMLANGRVTCIETKTEGKGTFAKRVKPTFEHELRTMLYLYLAARTPWLKGAKLNLDNARVVYLCKEGYENLPKLKQWGLNCGVKSPLKEYIVKRNDDMVETILADAQTYRDWRRGWELGATPALPEGICKSPGEPRAAECSVCALCFSKGGQP